MSKQKPEEIHVRNNMRALALAELSISQAEKPKFLQFISSTSRSHAKRIDYVTKLQKSLFTVGKKILRSSQTPDYLDIEQYMTHALMLAMIPSKKRIEMIDALEKKIEFIENQKAPTQLVQLKFRNLMCTQYATFPAYYEEMAEQNLRKTEKVIEYFYKNNRNGERLTQCCNWMGLDTQNFHKEMVNQELLYMLNACNYYESIKDSLNVKKYGMTYLLHAGHTQNQSLPFALNNRTFALYGFVLRALARVSIEGNTLPQAENLLLAAEHVLSKYQDLWCDAVQMEWSTEDLYKEDIKQHRASTKAIYFSLCVRWMVVFCQEVFNCWDEKRIVVDAEIKSMVIPFEVSSIKPLEDIDDFDELYDDAMTVYNEGMSLNTASFVDACKADYEIATNIHRIIHSTKKRYQEIVQS